MSDLALAIFDVDGTLVDSQAHIVAAWEAAFRAQGLAPPPRSAVLAIVGLTLETGVTHIAPPGADMRALCADYRTAYAAAREVRGAAATSPLYPGIRALLDRLALREDLLLAVATGKSRRGLAALVAAHGLEGVFVSAQTADDHPSKPHPSMILAALAESGVEATRAVMIGDTTFDMDMGRAAGVGTIGVTWGYPALTGADADHLVRDTRGLEAAIHETLGEFA